MDNYSKLKNLFNNLSIYDQINSILSWDMATMMPPKSRGARISQINLINENKKKIFELIRKEKIFKNINKLKLNKSDKKNLLLMEKEFDYFSSIPIQILNNNKKLSYECEGLWREARLKNNFNVVKRKLFELLKNILEISKILSDKWEKNNYDCLIYLYDKSLTSANIQPLFDKVEKFIKPIYAKHLSKKNSLKINIDDFKLLESQEFEMSKFFMKKLGFNFKKGRVDKSLHPFCGGFSEDIRITSRYENKPFSYFDALMHETGHALYEFGLPKKWKNQPLGRAGGMSLHESQSLFIEMQIVKSDEFVEYLSSILNKKSYNISVDKEKLTKLNKSVFPNFIRVEADELSYPLHIIHRYNLEKKIINDSKIILNLPDVWNKEFDRLFNLNVKNDNDGCLQDIHWYSGDFGYFPTYCIGAIIAAQIKYYLKKKHPIFFEEIKKGNFKSIIKWLRSNIHNKGSEFYIDELMKKITGEKLNTIPYQKHLSSKYL